MSSLSLKNVKFVFIINLQIVVLSGDPADRPCLVDFANLITKRLSLLECVNVVKDTMDWKNIEIMKSNGVQWLQSNQVKAFYSVTRHSNFSTGARAALEMSGLGRLKPNMLLLGFKENWQTCPQETKEYYQVLQGGFDIRLSVAILRISGGLDLAGQGESPVFTVETVKQKATIQISIDSGLDDMKDLPPPPPYYDQIPPQLSYREQQELQHHGKKSLFSSTPKKEKPRPVLINSQGGEIQDLGIIRKMTQFRGNDNPEEGFLDVYWLYDDGGLTLLLPYILTTRKKFAQCKLRIYVLGSVNEELDEETKNMAILLAKFRIEFHDIIILTDVTKYPGKKIRDEFKQMVKPLVQANGPRPDTRTADGATLMTQSDLANNAEKTNFHLRIAEIVRENSKHSSMIVMTLPMPKKDDSLPFGIYMSWLDITTRQMPPFLLIRGNQESVLTFYS